MKGGNMLRKADTSRVCLVLENKMIKILDKMAAEKNETRSECIRNILEIGCNWYTDKRFNKKTD